MPRLIHIAMALLLGLLIAAPLGGRDAAAQDRTRRFVPAPEFGDIFFFADRRRAARKLSPIAPPVFLLDPDPRIGLPDEKVRIMGGDGAGADAD